MGCLLETRGCRGGREGRSGEGRGALAEGGSHSVRCVFSCE